jgi:transmembrane sensor
MDISLTSREQIAAEAVEWALQLREPASSLADREAFSLWLTRSPVHIEEFLAASVVWATLDVPREGEFSRDSLIAAARAAGSDSVVRFSTAQQPEGREVRIEHKNRISSRRWWAMAALLLLGAAGTWFAFNWHQAEDFSTAIGEQRSVILADGSVVFLNTNSEIRVRLRAQDRQINLMKGEARFQVAKDAARPFWVVTAAATVRAVGTVFNVRADQAHTEVAVIEGRVKVSTITKELSVGKNAKDSGAVRIDGSTDGHSKPATIELSAGERAAIVSDRIESNAGRPMEAVVAWTERRLVFRDEPLSEVIAEFNRYRQSPLIAESPQLAELKINGIFNSNDADSLIEYLKSFETVRVARPPDGSVHLFLSN